MADKKISQLNQLTEGNVSATCYGGGGGHIGK